MSIYRPGQRLEARLEIPDELIGKLARGQHVELWSPNGSGNTITGIIDSLSITAYESREGRYFVGTAILDYSLPMIENSLGEAPNLKVSDYLVGMRLMANIDAIPFKNGVWIPRASADLQLPEDAISATISYLSDEGHDGTIASRERSANEANGGETMALDQSMVKPSPVGRSIATGTAPRTEKVAEIYVLSSEGKVIRTRVRLGVSNENFIYVPVNELRGARVVTHYRQKNFLNQILLKDAAE